jgi:hypothetical protein
MHEVKVFDSSGNLKKVISVENLVIRSDRQLAFPSDFRINKRIGKPWAKSSKDPAKVKTLKN